MVQLLILHGSAFEPTVKPQFLKAIIHMKFAPMGKEKTQEREQARDLFVNSNLTLKEISGIVNVSASRLGKWATADNWDLQKTAQQVTAGKIIAGWYAMLQKINEQIQKQQGIPDNGQIDQVSKITDSIQKLSKKQNLSMYHTVLKDFLSELILTDNEAAKKFGPYMLDFLKRKATQLKNDS